MMELFNQFSDSNKPLHFYNGAKIRVLLAEDCPETALLLKILLERAGCEVCHTESGLQCIETALFALSVNQAFDLLLLDIRLPEMDGHAVARLLRNKGYSSPIIATSASLLPYLAEESLESGCDYHMPKTTLHRTLPRLLDHLFPRRKAA